MKKSSKTKELKILIAEDEPILREMYVKKFSQAGFNAISADDGDEAFILAEKEKPNLILLDILMPKESGLEFLKKLRNTPDKKLAKTIVVAFSNLDEPKTKKEAMDLGVTEYIIKTNFTPNEIVKKVHKYLLKS